MEKDVVGECFFTRWSNQIAILMVHFIKRRRADLLKQD